MPRRTRILLIHLSLVLFAAALLARAAQVQVWQHAQWAARANRQHFIVAELPARRGNIYDVRGVPLAMSREMVRLAVAPRELSRPNAVVRELRRLSVAPSWIERATDRRRAWVALPGRYLPGATSALTAMRGVYADPVIDRVYTGRDATRRVVGWLDASGRPVGGIELAFDSLLRGRPGFTREARDARGRRFDSPADRDVEPIPGAAVTLTINEELQEISARALDKALASTGADGGDIVILDPRDGEIRAMASVRQGEPTFGSPIVNEPFEPGSTLKPLFAASLLTHARARPEDRVDTENGVYTVAGRTIHDLHRARELSLAEVLRWSSNIGIVKFVSRLSPREEFETLRDFGFGMPTGVPFPAESPGTLRPPAEWSRQSAASLAMGYEVAVTPLQLAVAYGAIANGGELLEPAIVREVRASDGRTLFRHTRRVVRRVMTPEVAAAVRAMMVGVVEGGTAREAALANFPLAGKSGTARRAEGGRGYEAGAYTASFVGLFPAEEPQYVILVKLDRPQVAIYGGEVAAPVSKIVLEAAIAARDAALDRRALAARDGQVRVVDSAAAQIAAGRAEGDRAAGDSAPIVLALTARDRGARGQTEPRVSTVPDVRGRSLREAVHLLHAAGLEVELAGFEPVSGTSPAAGATVQRGTVVRLIGTERVP